MQALHVEGRKRYDAIKAASPCSLGAAETMPLLYGFYWHRGITSLENTSQENLPKHLNPMFGTLHNNLWVHHGTDPFRSFHMSTAFTALSENSPLMRREEDFDRCFQAALDQFQCYTRAFRDNAFRIKLRFIQSDAMSFCQLMQNISEGRDGMSGLYRDRWSHEPLVLDSAEYKYLPSTAPISFDVIDTSNLADYVGCLNLFASASALLIPKKTSTLRMEVALLREEIIGDIAADIVGGDLPTVSLLFGLSSMQYWAQASPTPMFNEGLLRRLPKTDSSSEAVKCRYTLEWKRVCFDGNIRFTALELAKVVFRLYTQMFGDENMYYSGTRRLQYHQYTRANFCMVLRHIRNAGQVDWEPFIKELCTIILGDHSLDYSYIEGLFLHLHVLNLHTVRRYDPDLMGLIENEANGPLAEWANVPSVLCLTMVVPRSKLSFFKVNLPTKYGTPLCHVVLRSPSTETENEGYVFPDLQLGFGRVIAMGDEYTDNFHIQMEMDSCTLWDGDSDLIVSVLIPTWKILLCPDLSTEVDFGIRGLSESTQVLVDEFGPDLSIHKTVLFADDVFITRNPPNMPEYTSVCEARLPNGPDMRQQTREDQVVFEVSINTNEAKVHDIRTCVDLSSNEQDLLKNKDLIVRQISPFVQLLDLGSEGKQRLMQLPLPVQMTAETKAVCRPNDTSSVEYIDRVASNVWFSARPDGIFPIFDDGSTPVLQNLQYVNLDRLPILDLSDPGRLWWIYSHLQSMLTDRERRARDRLANRDPAGDAARIAFKNSLFHIFTHFVEDRNHKGRVMFSIDYGKQDRRLLLLPSKLRIDLSNQSIVLDAGVVSVTPSNLEAIRILLQQKKNWRVQPIIADPSELRIWQHTIPGFVERCRTWSHSSSCEYKSRGKIPLSFEAGQPILCSCGSGKCGDGYNFGHDDLWAVLSEQAVRIALSPCFPVPFGPWNIGNPDFDMDNAETHGRDGLGDLYVRNIKWCYVCGRTEEDEGVEILNCAECDAISYCSDACLSYDYDLGGHRATCRELKKMARVCR